MDSHEHQIPDDARAASDHHGGSIGSRFLSSIGTGMVVVGVVGSSWIFGYVEAWAQFLAAVMIAVGAAIAVGFRSTESSARISIPIFFASLFLVISVAQLVPLPREIIERVSPETNRLRAEFYPNDNLRSTVPISLTPADTRRAVGLGTVCMLALLTGFMCLRSTFKASLLLWSITISAIALGYIGVLCQIWNAGVYGFIPAEGGYFGSFGNRNNAAGFFCMAFACALFLFHGEVIRRRPADGEGRSDLRLGLAFLAILQIAAAICITTSRGGILAMIVAISAYVFVGLPGKLNRRIAICAVSLFVIAVSSFIYVDRFGQEEKLWQKLGTLTDSNAMKGETRLHHWQDSIATGFRFPWLGSGTGSYSQIYPLYDSLRIEQVYVHAENIFIETFVEMGIAGLVALMGFLIGILVTGFRLFHINREARRTAGFLLALVAGQIVSNSFDFGILLMGNMLVFSFLLGAMLGRAQKFLPEAGSRAGWISDQDSPEDRMPLIRPANIMVAALLLLVVPALADLYYCTMRQSLGNGGSVVTAGGTLDVDAEFVLNRQKRAVGLRPDDPELRRQLAESYISLLIDKQTTRTASNDSTAVGRFLWKVHAEAIADRRSSLLASRQPDVIRSESAMHILNSALQEYRRSAEFCGLDPTVHKRIAQLSFVDEDVTGELIALRRCMSIRAGICRELFRSGSRAIDEGKPDVAQELFRKCLTFQSVYEGSILSLASGHFSDDVIVNNLLPADVDRLQKAAVHFRGNAATQDISDRLTARANSVRKETVQRPGSQN